MIQARQIVLEVVRALCVLGLVFLNFGHVAAFAGDHRASAAASSYCVDPGDGVPDHAPCHACRIGQGADLPPPPAHPCRDPATTAVVFDAAAPVLPASPTWGFPLSRGPPRLV